MTAMNVTRQYRGMEKGHPVKVRGERGDFEFQAVYLDEVGEPLSVCVVGGTSGHRMFRHFVPERIIVKKARKQ